MRRAFVCAFATLLTTGAMAKDGPHCTSLKEVQTHLHNATARPLTGRAYAFAQGIYAGNPATPVGLPPGDGAIMFTEPDSDKAIIVFTTGAMVCGIPIAGDKQALLNELKGLAGVSNGDDAL